MTSCSLMQAQALLASASADPALQVRLDTMIFSLLIFVALILVLWKFAWKPIVQGLDDREKSIANDIDSAQQAHEKALATLAQYEQKIAAAGDEAAQVIAEARENAKREHQRIVDAANQEAARQRERAVAEIKAAKDQAIRELAEKSVDNAVALAKTMMGKELNRSDHQQLIEDSLQNFSAGNGFSNN